MKTFKDIKFKPHKVGKGAIQGLLMLDNGIELSVVAGEGMYSTGKGGVREAINKVEDASSFEVAIFDQDGKFIPADNDMVLGWQSREDIDKLIKIHS
ncbi:hypothetical protein N9034_01335 [bacterium]|nr:hypothetical protein [bacterium]MDB4489801.1 hypothetical protein [bacterium]